MWGSESLSDAPDVISRQSFVSCNMHVMVGISASFKHESGVIAIGGDLTF